MTNMFSFRALLAASTSVVVVARRAAAIAAIAVIGLLSMPSAAFAHGGEEEFPQPTLTSVEEDTAPSSSPSMGTILAVAGGTLVVTGIAGAVVYKQLNRSKN